MVATLSRPQKAKIQVGSGENQEATQPKLQYLGLSHTSSLWSGGWGVGGKDRVKTGSRTPGFLPSSV